MTISPRLLARTNVGRHVVNTVKLGANWMTSIDNGFRAWSTSPDDAQRTHDLWVARLKRETPR
jgi:hypothetical protein